RLGPARGSPPHGSGLVLPSSQKRSPHLRRGCALLRSAGDQQSRRVPFGNDYLEAHVAEFGAVQALALSPSVGLDFIVALGVQPRPAQDERRLRRCEPVAEDDRFPLIACDRGDRRPLTASVSRRRRGESVEIAMLDSAAKFLVARDVVTRAILPFV